MLYHRLLGFCMLATSLLTALPISAETLQLYEGIAPGSEQWQRSETVTLRDDGTQVFFNVRSPEVQVYLPSEQRANGTAAIMLPGGGLRMLSIGNDTQETIAKLNEQGVAVFLLKYRILQREPDTKKRKKNSGPIQWPTLEINNANANPSPNDDELNNVLKLAVTDTQETFKLIRRNAKKWRINPERIGFIGRSAGGGVALATYMARQDDVRPAFIVSDFGPSLVDIKVYPDAPPLFIATETYHGPVTDGLLQLAQLWRNAERPVELHMYSVAAFEMPVALWLDRLIQWLNEQGFGQ